MELKLLYTSDYFVTHRSINRTFMELKPFGSLSDAAGISVLIEPLWN